MSQCNFRGQSKQSLKRAPLAKSAPLPSLLLPTPVRFNRLLCLLSGYDHSTVTYLSSGFANGFPIHFEGQRSSSQAKNLLSAYDNPEVVDAKFKIESR